jgi:hypothetical protein
MKSKNITVLWSLLLLLAGGLFLAGFYLKDGDVLGPAFLFLCGLLFFGVTIRSKKGWWAIIPGGLIVSIGLVSVLETLIPHEDYPVLQNTLEWGVFTWVLMLGWAATFGYLWSLRKTQPTEWAKYPAVGLLALAILALLLGSRFQEIFLTTVMVVTGAVLLLALFTRKKLTMGQQTPKVKM